MASSKTSPMVTPDTAFMLASVSKVFTATAVLKLIDLGILSSLDDDICDVLPSSMSNTTACRNPHYPNIPVTWRMFLTHRTSFHGDVPYYVTNDGDELEAGYAPTGGYFGMAAGQTSCPMEDVRGFYRDILIDKESETIVGKNLGINWYDVAQEQLGGMWRSKAAPGEDVVYSNFAVGYVAALVEWALIKDQSRTSRNGSGQQPSASFANFSRHYIFEPLGMHNTSWFQRDLPSNVQVAMPVEPTNFRQTRFEDVGYYCFIDYASGSLFSTAADLAKFLSSMLNYGVPELWSDPAIGRRALNCLEHNVKGQLVRKGCEFGANWILFKTETDEDWVEPYKVYNWTNGAHHDGSEAGVQTQILVLPKAGVFAVVLTNTDENDGWAAQMMAMEILESIYDSGSTRTGGLFAVLWLTTVIMSLLWWL